MPLRDDYAMFGYGFMIEEEEDLLSNILYKNSDFDFQHIGENRVFIYYKPYHMVVGSRIGTFTAERKENFYPPMKYIEYNEKKYPLNWHLTMWG